MSELVDRRYIEGTVGAKRHATLHIGRLFPNSGKLYIMHSQECIDFYDGQRYLDLTHCKFSKALDNGLLPDDWPYQYVNKPVVLSCSTHQPEHRRVYPIRTYVEIMSG